MSEPILVFVRSELGSIVEHARDAGARGGTRLVGATCFAGFCCLFGVLLIPLVAGGYFLGRAVEQAATGSHDPRRDDAIASAGVLAFVGLLPFLGSMCVAVWVLSSFGSAGPGETPPGWALALQVVAAMLGGAALAPLAGAAHLRMTTATSVRDALAGSLALAARRPLSTALVGATQNALLSLPVVLLHTLPLPINLVAVVLGCVVSWACHPLVSAGLAAPSSRPLRPLAWLALPTVLALACVVPVWLGVPPRMWQPIDLATLEDASERGVIARAHGVIELVRRDESSTPYLRWPAGTTSYGLSVRREPDTARTIVAVLGPRGAIGVPLDERLHRLDDSPWDRVRSRADLGLAFFGALAALATAMAMHGVRRSRRRLGAGRATTEVVVRLGSSGKLARRDGSVVPDGEVWLEAPSGDGAVRLDRPVTLVTTGVDPSDGSKLLLVSERHAPRFGPRDGAAPISDGSWLTDDTDLEAAVILYSARVSAFAITLTILLGLLAAVAAACAI